MEIAKPEVVSAIIVKGTRVLVGKVREEKKEEFGGLKFIFPGGKQEEDETLEEAVIRETVEETKLRVKVIAKIADRIHPITGMHIHYFHCEEIRGKAPKKDNLNDDIMDLDWVEISDVQKFMPSIYSEVLTHLNALVK